MYNTINNMSMEDLKEFFNTNLKGEKYNVLVIGNKNDVDMKALSKLGKVQEMEVDDLFNYKNEKVKL